MAQNRSTRKQEDLILFAILALPTIWFALLLAPCLGDNLLSAMEKLAERIQEPWRIEWCENSIRSIVLCFLLYGFGGIVYFGTRPNLRQGEEHGSAKWGSPKELNA